MNSILITGCNRGLGLGLIKSILGRSDAPKTVIATCRDVDNCSDLSALKEKHNNLHIVKLDVQQYDTYPEFLSRVESILDSAPDGLNVLFNNAGMSAKYARLPFLKPEVMNTVLNTNAVSPLILTKTLLPLLKKSSASGKTTAVINMSSILGSLTLAKENMSPAFAGQYPYKCSKAALNMTTICLANELKEDKIIVTAMHPGWVKTDMGGPKAPLEVEESANGMLNFIYNINQTHTGGFYQYDGKTVKW